MLIIFLSNDEVIFLIAIILLNIFLKNQYMKTIL
jgi:regulatory protein YycI of two-component signal transduction system YycFG